jgi:predicted XRE-type DNA-binding protein
VAVEPGRQARDLTRKVEVEQGGGNVFAGLDLAMPGEHPAKARRAMRIATTIRARQLTQARAARLLRIDQPKVSRLLPGQLSAFSTERLIQFLALLGSDVEIIVEGKPRS